MSPRLTLVIPCYNEAARLAPAAFARFFETRHDVLIQFIDDGSRDRTHDLLDEIRRAHPHVVSVLSLDANVGKAEAVRIGLQRAFERATPLVGYFDADLSTPLEAVDDFLWVLEERPEIEVVLGSRVMLLGRDIRRWPLRHYVGRVFATAASLALDLPVYDTQCGAKVLRATPAVRAIFAEPFQSRWVFDVEWLQRYLAQPVGGEERPRRERLYELALERWHDVSGSHIRLSQLWHVPMALLAVWWRRRRSRSTRT